MIIVLYGKIKQNKFIGGIKKSMNTLRLPIKPTLIFLALILSEFPLFKTYGATIQYIDNNKTYRKNRIDRQNAPL